MAGAVRLLEYETAYSNVQNADDAMPKATWMNSQTLKISIKKVAAIRERRDKAGNITVIYDIGTVMYR